MLKLWYHRLTTTENTLVLLLFIATCWSLGQTAPIRPLILLLLTAIAGHAVCPGGGDLYRNCTSGLLLGSLLIPLGFLGQDINKTTIVVNMGFLVSWLTSVGISTHVVGRNHPKFKFGLLTGILLLSVRLYNTPSWCAIPHSVIGFGSFLALTHGLPKSFSTGEATILGQLFGLLSCAVYNYQIDRMTRLRIAMSFGIFGAFIVAVIVVGIKRIFKARQAIITGVTLVGVFTVFWIMSVALDQNSLVWLWGYTFAKKAVPAKFIGYYCLVLVIGLPFAPRKFECRGRPIARKYFHALALVMFVPTVLLHVRFLALAFAVAFSVFMVIEACRVAQIQPITSYLTPLMSTYVDDKDTGTAILTHIHLLLGCAIPVWYIFVCHHGGIFSASSLLCAIDGVTVTGLGDACASIMGVIYGRLRWSSVSRKTVEGSLAMVISIVVFQTLMLYLYGFHNLSTASWSKLILSDALVVLLEATTDQVDNLILPLYHIVALQLI